MSRGTILVVDDEADIRELLRYNLRKEGFSVDLVGSGEDALTRARETSPDAIVLDLMLPGIDGREVCRRLKADEHTHDIPIVMLTARSEESDMVAGLETGADDYVTKPFSPAVLTARLQAVLRRRPPQEPGEGGRLSAHGLVLDIGRHELSVGGRDVPLSATEFSILAFLMSNPGWVFSRTRIIDAVRGKDYPVTERSVDVQILGLRKKLGDHGSVIETVRGVGYRFRAI